jgi:hypothetical protein
MPKAPTGAHTYTISLIRPNTSTGGGDGLDGTNSMA